MNKIVVKIANQEYTITGEEEKDYILSLASHVDEQIRIAQNKAPKINNLTPVILASINITDQLFKEIKKSREMSNQINGEKPYTDQDKITREGEGSGAWCKFLKKWGAAKCERVNAGHGV